MSRLLLTTALWHLVLYLCTAQDARLFNQVVASTGYVAVQQGLTYTYTVGEVVISTIGNGSLTLTEGFHQPEQTGIVSVDQPELADWNIEVFPNPVTDWLTVRFSAEQGRSLSVSVFDVAGRCIVTGRSLEVPDGSSIECRSWQPGIYFLQLQDPRSRASATIRIVRL